MKHKFRVHRSDLLLIGSCLLDGLAASRSFRPHLASNFLYSAFDVVIAVFFLQLGEKFAVRQIEIKVLLLVIRASRIGGLNLLLDEYRLFVVARLFRLQDFNGETCVLFLGFPDVYEDNLICLNCFGLKTFLRFS